MNTSDHYIKKIICFGDSNTWGYNPEDSIALRYPADVRWIELVAAAHPDIEFINKGRNGRKIPKKDEAVREFLDFLDKELSSGTETELWIMLGTNDTILDKGIIAEDVAARMNAFVNAVTEHLDKAGASVKISLISPLTVTFGDWVSEQRVIDQSVRLMPFYRAIAESNGFAFADATSVQIPLLSDGVHFTAEGHRIFAQQVVSQLVF